MRNSFITLKGDRVSFFNDMMAEGTVIELKQYRHKTWMVGGTTDQMFKAVVRLDKTNEIREHDIQELMRLD